jgi:hypothetical protein
MKNSNINGKKYTLTLTAINNVTDPIQGSDWIHFGLYQSVRHVAHRFWVLDWDHNAIPIPI